MKWALVLAGASDFTRPADQLSLNTNFALMCTGAIWTRWCLIIKPKNVFLGAVNFFLFLVGGTQVIRILMHQRSVGEAKEEVKVEAAELKEGLERTKEKAEGALKQ
jgi:trans-2-enoyl-CoA reductase